MKIIQQFLTPNKYSRPQIPLETVTKVAVHYTGNPGSTAQNNRDYFESLGQNHSRYVSSHYIVGMDGEVLQCIPEDEWSYCTNQANGYSISIETCHPDETGKFTAASEASLAELVADICKRHNLDPMNDVIRHYDVTGKQCPLWYVNHPKDWERFKERVSAILKPEAYAVRIGHFSEENRAREVSGMIFTLGFYNAVREDGGKYMVDVFSFTDKERADALAALLKQNLYSYVLRV